MFTLIKSVKSITIFNAAAALYIIDLSNTQALVEVMGFSFAMIAFTAALSYYIRRVERNELV